MALRAWQKKYTDAKSACTFQEEVPFTPQLALVFGSRELIENFSTLLEISDKIKQTQICGCSTAGEIYESQIATHSIVVTCLKFDSTKIKTTSIQIKGTEESLSAGIKLGESLLAKNLKHIIVLSEGLNINGSELVAGLRTSTNTQISITGGLAGDMENFEQTFVLRNKDLLKNGLVGIGFYGDKLTVGCGSLGGWDSFGPERIITKSEKNKLFELDDQPALQLYREYLGTLAKDLPASGLLFPLCVKIPGCSEPLVRTLLGIDDQANSLTFAGDLPQGCTAQMMRANTDRLLDGAASAAAMSCVALDQETCQFALLVSCVGRRLVLKQRAEDEIEAARSILGSGAVVSGFYSYGEISPFITNARCELHNQTMTISSFYEKD